MAKPIKICRNYSTTALKKVNESAESTANKKYVFQGVFTACSTPDKTIINRNNRSYPEKTVLAHISYLRDAIKNQGCILGELDHPEGRFDIQLKEASHKIVDLWYDTKTHCVMGKIELLDTPNGNIAKELVDAGYPLFVSSRAAGDVDEETHEVSIAQIFTYDIVCTPGFEEARLERVNESLMSSAALHYINESVGSKKKIKNSTITITESTEDFVMKDNVIRALNTPINMKAITKPLHEEESNSFQLPEAELDPNKIDSDDKEDKKDSDDKSKKGKEVKDESPEKKEKLDKKKDISEDDDEAKEDKRKAILGIKAEDSDGNVINTDNEAKSESEQEENRSKILKVYSEEASESDDKKEPAENAEESEENTEADDEDIKEANAIKNKVIKETDKTVDELEALLDSVIKTESVKESIIRRYPFAISLSEDNFGKFAALRPNQKKKCAAFIEEHQIFDVNAINELWSTPLRQEKRLRQNWLRLASQHDIDLYTMAPKDVQDAIEESAKYLVLETQEQVNDFWLRTGLRQAEARRLMNEQFVNNYKTAENSPYDQTMNQNNDPLGYSFDYVQMVEDMMKAGY